MIQITNPCNGFARIEAPGIVLLTDPWTTGGIFDGSWHPHPPLQDPGRHLEGATHVFLSHMHEDHYDLATLRRLDRGVTILVPDQYPNSIMAGRLEALGFRRVLRLPLGRPVGVDPGLTVEVVPPMNVHGLETERQEDGSPASITYQIDAGALFCVGGRRLAFLADNQPYHPELAGETLGRLRNLDLLAFSYNGVASDYPLCYENLSAEEVAGITTAREVKRAGLIEDFIALVEPRALLLYSSEFALAGPLARRYAELMQTGFWAEKGRAAEAYGRRTGRPAFGLYEGDCARFGARGWEVERRGSEPPPLSVVADALYSAVPNTRTRFVPTSGGELDTLYERATSHVLGTMDRRRLSCDWTFVLAPDDLELPRPALDFGRRARREAPDAGAKVLTCRAEANYLAALLRGESHWNNARISFNLRWTRLPNQYDHALFDLLNFLHIPIDRQAPAF